MSWTTARSNRVRIPKNAHLWMPGYVRHRLERAGDGPPRDTTIDIVLTIADHFEPDHGRADAATRRRRVARWREEYPRLAAQFADSDGCPPRHTFFSPLEVYEEDLMEGLAALCRDGFGEVEVHLHHGHDSSEGLRDRLEWFRDRLVREHGLLARDQSGQPRYAFVHGNWALDNGRGDDRFCGVNDEITVLRETGCYADFTMPAAPDSAQSRIVNSIYYAVDDPERPRSYDRGHRVTAGRDAVAGGLMMIQGPLALRWRQRVYGIAPRLDNGAIDATPHQRPTLDRFRGWLGTGISVAGRPEWVFIKLHTHGAKEANADVLLGRVMAEFHELITTHFNDGVRYRLHYATAREMFNIAKAAEDGRSGNAGRYRDYLLAPSIGAGAVQ